MIAHPHFNQLDTLQTYGGKVILDDLKNKRRKQRAEEEYARYGGSCYCLALHEWFF